MKPATEGATLSLFGDSIQERFERFHDENPQVYATLVKLARGYAARGERRGIKHLWEVARYMRWLETDGDPFKLNNDFTSRYARKIMAREPDLAGFFDLRELGAL